MPWSRPLPEPIVLMGGRVIVTLNDARVIMESLPTTSQTSNAWHTCGLMLEAATAGGPIHETAAQLRRALKAEGLI
jgi:hypothetical protein